MMDRWFLLAAIGAYPIMKALPAAATLPAVDAPGAAAIRATQVGFVDFVIRGNPADLGDWYRGVLRLPMIRGSDAEAYLWVGGTRIVELLDLAPGASAASLDDPASAPTIPVFRTRDMDGLVARLERRGTKLVARTRSALGDESLVRDPQGNLLGFRAPSALAGRRRMPRADDFNPGVSMLPPDVDGLDWIVRHVVDLDASARFYRDVVMLRELPRAAGRIRFDIGFGTTLELAPGGKASAPVTSRTQVPATFILRVEDHDLENAWLKRNDVRIVDDALSFNSAKLTYYLDPDGHMIGTDERFEPAEFKKPRRPFMEDLEIERRWKARTQLGDAF